MMLCARQRFKIHETQFLGMAILEAGGKGQAKRDPATEWELLPGEIRDMQKNRGNESLKSS